MSDSAVTMVTMLCAVLGMVVAMTMAHTPTPDPPPSNTVRDDHKYYTLEVYQNNNDKSFDNNFIDMENAEVKSGKLDSFASVIKEKSLFNNV